MSLYFALYTVENKKNKKSVKFQGDMLNFCDFIQVFVFTRNHHLNLICTPPILLITTVIDVQQTYIQQLSKTAGLYCRVSLSLVKALSAFAVESSGKSPRRGFQIV